MQASDLPGRISKAFAAGGGHNTIPVASQIGITPGKASYTDGFPPLTRTPLSGGGIPPFGLDMNGILFDVSAWCNWDAAGGQSPYNSTFAGLIGGYPNGAVVQSADKTGWWRCTTDNNSTDPDAGGAGWLPHFFYGLATQSLTSSNVTLTALQYSKSIITLSGTLTANVNLVFPNSLVGQWLVVNNTTGSFTITAKTVSGTGVTVSPGVNSIYSDGTNMLLVFSNIASQSANIGFTPTLQFGGASVGVTYGSQFGLYVQTGRLVFVYASVIITAKGSSTGNATLSCPGIPTDVGANTPLGIGYVGMNALSGPLVAVSTAPQTIAFRKVAATFTGNSAAAVDTDFTNGFQCTISGIYLTS